MSKIGHFTNFLSTAPRALSKQTAYALPSLDGLETQYSAEHFSITSSQKSPGEFRQKMGLLNLLIIFSIIVMGFVVVVPHLQSRTLFFFNKADISGFLGFGIEQITLSGYRSTSEDDIFEALKLDKIQSFFDFKSLEVETHLKRLPWVKDVSIKRIWPNQLVLHFIEREPFAVWQHSQGIVLIDGEGRTLGSLKTDIDLPLPRFSGEGANTRASEFWSLLQSYPQIRDRIKNAEYVDKRRWSVKLKNELILDLPANFEGPALSFLTSKRNLGDLLEKSGCRLDLRIQRRVILRANPEAKLNACFFDASSESMR